MIEPLVAICLDRPRRVYHPGELLKCQYQIDAASGAVGSRWREAGPEILAIEASVLWRTEGKGDEDLAVHFFQRHVPTDVLSGELRQLFQLETRLPNSPLSYEGLIVKIGWCVRVRAFLKPGSRLRVREALAEKVFELTRPGIHHAAPRRPLAKTIVHSGGNVRAASSKSPPAGHSD